MERWLLYAGAPKTLLTPLQKTQNRANRAGLVVPHEPLQSVSERFDVATMTVFYNHLNSPPSLDLSRLVPLTVQPTRQTRKHTAWSKYPHEPLQSVNERFDVASMTVFYNHLNSPPSLDLARIVPLTVQPTRQTRKLTARSKYPHEPLQSVNERFDVASMTVFYNYLNSPPSLGLSRLVPLIVQPKRKHTARSNYLEAGKPRTKYLKSSFIRSCTSVKDDLPEEVTTKSVSIDSFKRRFNNHLETSIKNYRKKKEI